jgi:hypothetical protein
LFVVSIIALTQRANPRGKKKRRKGGRPEEKEERKEGDAHYEKRGTPIKL